MRQRDEPPPAAFVVTSMKFAFRGCAAELLIGSTGGGVFEKLAA